MIGDTTTAARTHSPVWRQRAGAVLLSLALVALLVCSATLRASGAAAVQALPGLRKADAWAPWLLPLTTLACRVAQLATIGFLLAAAALLPVEGRSLSPEGWLAARWAARAAAVWAAGQVLILPLTASDLLGISPWSLSASSVVSTIRDLEAGQALALIAVLAALTSIVARATLRRAGAITALALALVAIVPQTASGHSVSSGSHQIAVSSLILHLFGVVVWAGGLLALVTLAPRLGTASLSAAAARFSGWAGPAAAIVLLSGLGEALLSLRTPHDWLATGYGAVASLKLLATVLLLGAGWWQRRRFLARLAAGDRQGFALLALSECVLLAATMGLAVALSRMAPPPRTRAETYAESVLGFPMPEPLTWSRVAFDWYPEPIFLTGALAAAALYVGGVARMRRNGVDWPLARTICWLGGCLLVLVAMCSGMARYAPVLAWMHMMQHLVLAIYAAPLLVLGAPITLALRAIRPAPDPTRPGPREAIQAILHSRLSRVLAHPVAALAIFSGSMFAIFFSGLYELMLRSHVAHLAISAHFLLSGYLFYWVIIGIDPAPRRISAPMRLIALLISAVAHTVFGVALMASTTPLAGSWFASLGRNWGPTPVDDTQTAGAIAWTFGELPFAVIILVLLFAWARDDEREQRRRDRAATIKGSAEAAAIEDYNRMLARLADRDPD